MTKISRVGDLIERTPLVTNDRLEAAGAATRRDSGGGARGSDVLWFCPGRKFS